jgi:hypothetical protein
MFPDVQPTSELAYSQTESLEIFDLLIDKMNLIFAKLYYDERSSDEYPDNTADRSWRLALKQECCRRKAIHSADFALRQPPIVTVPEDSFCSATAVQEETYAIWLYGKTQSQARSGSLAVSVVCNRP